jgi:hypothetical protein
VAFDPQQGKEVGLAPVESSCPPLLKRVGPGLLVSLNCRGITGKVMLTAYDFVKNELWGESLAQSPVPPTFVMAGEVGRFAMSRINSVQSAEGYGLGPDDSATQEVRVYQTQTGDMLLKLSCTPVYRTAENFDLSADGRRLAVVRGDAIEVYPLPALSKTDLIDMETLKKMAPEAGYGKFDLRGLLQGSGGDGGAKTVAAGQVGAAEAPANGDQQGPRKAPTILKPGEKPDFGRGNEPE